MSSPDNEYDWENPDRRALLRVGTVLETYDCGYIRVEQIVPEGVVSRGVRTPRRLWTWKALKKLECIIYHQPGDGHTAAEEEKALYLVLKDEYGAIDRTATGTTERTVTDLQEALGRELVDLAPASASELEVRAEVSAANSSDARIELRIVTAGCTPEEREPNASVKSGVLGLRDFMLECQGRTWNGLRFTVTRGASGAWRYHASYTYPSGAP
jgi:hypothetical protein